MNKQEWLKEAIDYIDSLTTEEFEEFLASCAPFHDVKVDYREIQFGKSIVLSNAANMACFYPDDISLAA